LLEVAGAGLDLHADDQAKVEPAGVAGLNEQVGPQVMLRVGDRPQLIRSKSAETSLTPTPLVCSC
jgi:hypothetical protein